MPTRSLCCVALGSRCNYAKGNGFLQDQIRPVRSTGLFNFHRASPFVCFFLSFFSVHQQSVFVCLSLYVGPMLCATFFLKVHQFMQKFYAYVPSALANICLQMYIVYFSIWLHFCMTSLKTE